MRTRLPHRRHSETFDFVHDGIKYFATVGMNAQTKIVDPVADERFDMEVQLLGALLAYGDPATQRAAAAIVEPVHFGDDFNARLFGLIGQGVDAGLSAFRLTHWVICQLRGDETIAELETTASALLARYIAQAAPKIAIEGCARQVRHDCLRAQLQRAVDDHDTGDAETIAAEMEKLSRAHLVKDEGLETIGALSNKIVDKLNAAFQAGGAPRDYAFAGSTDLARAIGGWRRGRMYVLAGRPGMGKSTLALSLLLRTAGKGHGVLMFALEMGREELTEMALCDLAWSSSSRVEYRDIAASAVMKPGFQDKFSAVYQVSHMLNSMPLLIGDRGGLTIAEIRSQALQFKQRLEANGKRLEVICIDHLGLIRAGGAYAGNKVAETEEISGALKALAKELQCAVVALAQLNRGVESRDDKRPSLSDLRWSGSIEQDADVVMFVYREAYYLERAKHDDVDEELKRQQRLAEVNHKLEVQIAKHRGGPCAGLEFFADMGCGVVRDMERKHHV